VWDRYFRDRGVERRLRDLMGEHHDFIWRNLRRLGVPQTDVDDAAQEVFLVLAKKLSSVSPGRERAFLLGTALRVASNFRRKKRPLLPEHSLTDEAPDAGFSPEELRELLLARQRLDEILDGLPEEQRTVFVLCELEQLTVQAAAELLDVPVGTATSRLRAARQLFNAAIERLQARPVYGRSSA
jgi:RNA polymerase sigma-70 factor (ECF subfamily)